MRFGPDKIIACPNCQKPARKTSMMSGNTFGAKFWSDGLHQAPMMLRNPPVVKCSSCEHIYWLSDATQTGECSRHDKPTEPKEWKDANYVREISEKDYYKALKEGLAETPSEERCLRILTWWKSNESQRRCYRNPEQVIDTSMRQDNIAALIPLLDEKLPDDRLMKAEALRQLSRFDEALGILEQIASPQSLPIVRKLKAFCENKNCYLQRIETDDEEPLEEIDREAVYLPVESMMPELPQKKPWWRFW